jgi:hypothetical protein
MSAEVAGLEKVLQYRCIGERNNEISSMYITWQSLITVISCPSPERIRCK